jgi:hypothetical protein
MARDPEKALTPAESADLRARLSRLNGKARLDLLLEARDPGALIRALPADDLHATIREIGLADAGELVRLASAEQFRALLDLDAWRRDRFEARAALPWLRAARAGALDDPRAATRWARKLRTLDRELLFLLLRETLTVHDLEEEPDPELGSDRVLRSPEGRFAVEFRVDGAEYAGMKGLLDDLYAEDPFQAARLLSAIRWELPSELEETALRWRQGRLADLGFPPLEEALSWFARPPPGPAAAPPAGAPERPPGLVVSPPHGSLLARALSGLDPSTTEAVAQELAAAGNAAIVADGVDPSDVEEARAAVAGARFLLELGLSRLAAGDEVRAAAVLAELPLKRISQEGAGQLIGLSARAARLLASGRAGTRAAPFLDAPLGEALAALSARRPRTVPGLGEPRERWGTPAAAAGPPRRLLSHDDLARAEAAVALGEALVALAAELGLTPAAGDAAAPRLSTLYLTALANERLGRPFTPAPLPPGEATEAARRLADLSDPRLAGRGEAGALLGSLAARRLEELTASLEASGDRPDRATGLLLSPPAR